MSEHRDPIAEDLERPWEAVESQFHESERVDEAAVEALLERLPASEAILVALPSEQALQVRQLAEYPADQAGGLMIGPVAWLWKGNPMLGVVVGVALCVNTLLACSLGGLLPLLRRRMNRDPALASGPILTTVTDMCGFFIVLSLAALSLRYLV